MVTTPANQTTVQGAAASLQIAALDVEGDVLTYSATGLPTGLAVASGTVYIR